MTPIQINLNIPKDAQPKGDYDMTKIIEQINTLEGDTK